MSEQLSDPPMMAVTQEMWDRAQDALRAVLPHLRVPPLSTAGTMVSLRDKVRAAIVGVRSQEETHLLGLIREMTEQPSDQWSEGLCGRIDAALTESRVLSASFEPAEPNSPWCKQCGKSSDEHEKRCP